MHRNIRVLGKHWSRKMTDGDGYEIDEALDRAFLAWVKRERPIDEVPGSDHERRISWYAFREGWIAAKASGSTGDKA